MIKIKKVIFKGFLLIPLFLWYTNAFAQLTVKGKVVDYKSKQALPGVNIVVKGTTNGTATNPKGKYSLTVPASNDTLVFSYIGYQSKTVPIRGRSVINVKLKSKAVQGKQLVVVGYGTMKKQDLTSSISNVSSKNFVHGAVRDAGQLLAGKVAGLTINNPSGNPTSTSQISLRGTTTLLGANTQPLVLVNGIPGNLNTVAPQDIKSISVLKGGSAAAIYGSRASNGVILITTKQASGHYANTVEYSSYVSTQTIENKLNMLTAADYRKQVKEGLRAASWNLGHSNDWLKLVTRTPISNVQNLTLHGGNNKTNYVANLNWRSMQGIFKKSDNKTLRARVGVNHMMFNNKLKVHIGYLNSTNSYNTTADGNSFNPLIYRMATIFNPTAPIYNSKGQYYQNTGLFEYTNPLSMIYTTAGKNTSQNSRLDGTLTFNPINNLTLKGLFSYSHYNQTRGYYETHQNISTIRGSRNGYASDGAHKSTERLLQFTAKYANTIGNNNFTILGGYSYQYNMNRDFYMQNYEFPTDHFLYNNIGIGNALQQGRATMNSSKSETNLISFFSRATYSYKNTYLLMASMRYEAASQLYGTKEPWGAFPAISVGWRLTNMSFMKHQKLFNNLKLRVGYGVTGNQPKQLFLGVAELSYNKFVYYDGKWIRTLVPSQNPNPNLKWEEKKEIDAGLDYSMLNDRVSGSIDYYIRHIDGLLYNYQVPSPPNLYSSTEANVGKMQNKGWEFSVKVIPVKTHNFEWTSHIDFYTNSNKLISLSNSLYKATNNYFTTGYTGDPIQTFTNIVRVGQPIGDFYGFKVIGIDKKGKWIYEGKNGKPIDYSNFNHSFENKRVLGNGIPKYHASWNNTFSYKNWDLTITMRGAFKFQILNYARMYYENPGIQQYNRLKSAYNKVFGKRMLSKNVPLEFNSYYIENGDYWKIDNITLGYNFNTRGIKFIHSARIYVSSLDTYIITGYKGISPVVNDTGLAPGNDNRDKYPTTRTYTLGIDLNF